MTTINEIATERFDALEKHVGLNAGNYIIHHVSGEISIFSDHTNGKEAVKWLYNEYFPNGWVIECLDDYDTNVGRLIVDMKHLGHDWCFSIRKNEEENMRLPSLRLPIRKRIRRGKEQPNMLYSDNYYERSGYGQKTMQMFIVALKQVGFVELAEQVIYDGHVDSRGIIKTPHKRVVITSDAQFVSHPMCSRCGKHTDACMAFIDYEKAVEWAEYDKASCDDCLTDDEIDSYDEDYDGFDDPETGMAVECPMRENKE